VTIEPILTTDVTQNLKRSAHEQSELKLIRWLKASKRLSKYSLILNFECLMLNALFLTKRHSTFKIKHSALKQYFLSKSKFNTTQNVLA
jgi:hypothetical protein